MSQRIKTYDEFFPYYLREHSLPRTRALHYVGTTFFLASLVAFVVTFKWGFLVFAVVIGYVFAWIGHFFIEKNRPATFSYPGWSFISDLKMYFLFVTGQLGKHLEAAGVGAVDAAESKVDGASRAAHEPELTIIPEAPQETSFPQRPEGDPDRD